jgi:hypothetical protein
MGTNLGTNRYRSGNSNLKTIDYLLFVAEREGFEPPIGLYLCRISSAMHSTIAVATVTRARRGLKGGLGFSRGAIVCLRRSTPRCHGDEQDARGSASYLLSRPKANERAKGFESSTPTLARSWSCFNSLPKHTRLRRNIQYKRPSGKFDGRSCPPNGH